jgi:signal transduction histidine kinase
MRLMERLWLVPALLVLGLIAGAVVPLWEAATDGARWDVVGRITEVDAGGPAERAGLRVGDVLLTIDDCPVAAWDGCGYRIIQPGDVITVTFERQGRVYTTNVTVEFPPVGSQLVRVLNLPVALVFCLASLVLLLQRPEAEENRAFYALCQVAATSLTVGALASVMVPYGPRWFHVLNGMLPPVIVHFHAVFPKRHWLARTRWPLPALYGAGLVLVALRWLRPVLSYPSIEASQAIMHLWLFLGAIAAIGLVITTYVTTASAYARRRIRLLVFGTLVGFGPAGLVTAVPTAGFGANAWLRWPFVIPLMAAMPVAYAVALWRYSLVGFDRALNRGLVYLLVSTILFGVYFAALTFFHTLLPVNMVGRAALGAAVALVAAVTLRPLRDRVQRLVDRLFYGGWYDYRGLVEEVGQALARTLDPETLAEVLVRRVPRAMHLPGSALWLERAGRMEIAGTSGVDVRDAQARAREGGAAGLWAVSMARNHAVVPLVVEGQEVGTWVLAARRGEEWGPEDERILAALGHQAALAAQNVRLVAALRAKVAEVEDVHRRLLVAREEERADLARELHDGVIQDLIGLRYRLEALQEEEEKGEGEEAERVEEVHVQVGELVDELRRLCGDLRPSALDQLGLAAALRELAREVTARGLPVEVHLEDVVLPDEVAIGLYRICQEALSNAWRHAEATQAVVALACEEDGVVLTVADDGCGFDPALVREQNGCFGLLGMSERAETLGGHLVVESAPGEGTRVMVQYGPSGPAL